MEISLCKRVQWIQLHTMSAEFKPWRFGFCFLAPWAWPGHFREGEVTGGGIPVDGGFIREQTSLKKQNKTSPPLGGKSWCTVAHEQMHAQHLKQGPDRSDHPQLVLGYWLIVSAISKPVTSHSGSKKTGSYMVKKGRKRKGCRLLWDTESTVKI